MSVYAMDAASTAASAPVLVSQLWTAVLMLVAIVGAGGALAPMIHGRLTLPIATRIALIPATGFAFVGVATLLAGHLYILGPWLPYALAGIGVVLGALRARELRALVSRGATAVAQQFRSEPVALAAVSLALLVAAVATIVQPVRTDEIEYHWPAALDWAASGGWTDSPFRHVDAFPFMEIVYTAAATQGSYVAAHLVHFTLFLALGFAVAGIASTMGVRGTGVTAAAVLAMPVVWDTAYIAYNDTPVGLMSVLAVAVVMAAPPASMRAAWIAGGILLIGTSIKPTGIAGAGLLAVMILIRYFYARSLAARTSSAREPFADVVKQWAAIVIPPLGAIAFWSVRQYLYTGNWVDPRMLEQPDAYAQTMLPNAVEQALAPLLPFVSGIIGAVEPWGGRTAVALQLFLIPAIVYVIWRRGDVLRRFVLMVVPAWAHWIVLGFAIVRTRFHVASWALMIVGVRIAVEDFAAKHPRSRIWLTILWTACILLGLADVALEMVRHLGLLVLPGGE